jgi:hypothetical protein
MRLQLFRVSACLLLLFGLAPVHAPANILNVPNLQAPAAAQPRASAAAETPDWQHRGHLVEFDAPGAATSVSSACAGSFYSGATCGTSAFSINDWGVSVGTFTDKNVVPHAFARDRKGRFLVFDAPGAGLGHGLNEGTVAYAINDCNSIAGEFQDTKLVFHSFIRRAHGAITVFDLDGAGKGAFQGTVAWDINARDETAGVYYDAKNRQHGFVRSSAGKVTSFDPPGSVLTYTCEETCLNDAGQVAGTYFDAKGNPHGFLRERDGRITEFNVPGPVAGSVGASLTPDGAIAGYYLDAKFERHGFVRFPDGKFLTFNAPTANDPNIGVYSINRRYAIAGITAVNQGFERFPNTGHVAVFSAPNAGPAPNYGTRPSVNNAWGEVAGWYFDTAGLSHGFVWSP